MRDRLQSAGGRCLAILLLLIGSTVVIQLTNTPTAHAVVQKRLHQYNMCGGACYDGSDTSQDLVAFMVWIDNPRPWVISLQEVCYQQYLDLKAFLQPMGYSGDYRHSNDDAGGCDSGAGNLHGNALFMLGTPQAHAYIEVFDDQDVGHGDNERNIICRRSYSVYVGGFVGCSTHYHFPMNGQRPTNQNTEAFWFVATNFTYEAVTVGGDFNLTFPGGWGTNWWELDPLLRFTFKNDEQANVDPTWKIDWVWGNRSHHSSNRTTGVLCHDTIIDHCYIAGTFNN